MIIFIDPKIEGYDTVDYPTPGIAYLSEYMDSNGIENFVFDLRSKKTTLDVETVKNADYAAISSMSFGFRNTLKIAESIKKINPQIKIILGGPHASMMRERVFKESGVFDFIVAGEGERSLYDLVEGKDLSKVGGLIYKEKNKIKMNQIEFIKNLDEIPFPKYRRFDVDIYTEFSKSAYISTSRGCPFQCVFCGANKIMGRTFRYRSPENIMKEIDFLKKNFGVEKVKILDENFTTKKERAICICEYLIKKDIKMELVSGIRVSTTDKEHLEVMKEAGLKQVSFGIESANSKVLKQTKKSLDLKKTEYIISQAKKLGLKTRGFFIVGLPGDNPRRFQDSINFINKTKLDSIGINIATPIPGTELYNWVKNNGKFLVDPYEYMERNAFTPNFSQVPFDTPDFTAEERLIAYRKAIKLRNRLDRLNARIIRRFFYHLVRGNLTKENLKEWMRIVNEYIRTGYYP